MARSRNPAPIYRKHQQTGRGRLAWTDSNGTRHEKLLPGAFNSRESLAAKARLELEIASSVSRSLDSPESLTLAEVMAAYFDYAHKHYRHPDGTSTSQLAIIKLAIKAFRQIYADTPIKEFTPLCVKAARAKWIEEGRTRVECNRHVAILKRMLKWGVSELLVPPVVYQTICTLTGLQKGRTEARELPPVKAVDDRVIDATLPYLNRHVRGLVEFQRLTGCRPGEACSLRRCDIDTGGDVWLYSPVMHKGSWRGKSRTIAIGPRGQELVKTFFTTNINDYLFCPRRACEEVIAERSASRKTPRWPSHMTRNVKKRKGRRYPLQESYSKGSYEQAIDRACDRAFPHPTLAQRNGESHLAWLGGKIRKGPNKGKIIKGRLTEEQREEVIAWQKAHRWNPNQLRHSHATRVRKEFGLEAAGAALGHSKMSATEVYAERDAKLAAHVAAKLG